MPFFWNLNYIRYFHYSWIDALLSGEEWIERRSGLGVFVSFPFFEQADTPQLIVTRSPIQLEVGVSFLQLHGQSALRHYVLTIIGTPLLVCTVQLGCSGACLGLASV